jgi:hypothetical protein
VEVEPGDDLIAGGQIERAGTNIARVEVRFALQDDAAQDVALFITDDPVVMPSTVVLLDSAGVEVAEHGAFPG